MKKRIIATVLLIALSLTLFAACGKKDSATITSEQAQKIALEELGKTANQVEDIHVHVTEYNGAPCYQIHITEADHEHTVYVDHTGKVLHKQ